MLLPDMKFTEKFMAVYGKVQPEDTIPTRWGLKRVKETEVLAGKGWDMIAIHYYTGQSSVVSVYDRVEITR